MKTKLGVVGVVAFLVVLTLPLGADAQTCFFVGRMTDGTVLGPYSLSAASNDISLTLTIELNRSYSIQASTQRGPSGSGSLAAEVNLNSSFCPVTDTTDPDITIRDTTGISPAASNGVRRSIMVTGPASSFLEMRIHNTDTDASSVVVKASETTQFHPGWSTGGGFNTFYSILNTTNSVCNVTMKLFNLAGAEVATTTQAIAARALLATNTSSLGVGAGLAGSGTLIHDCPPGGILVDAAIANFGTSPAAIIPAKFGPVRE
jgi:hypothetical protein